MTAPDPVMPSLALLPLVYVHAAGLMGASADSEWFVSSVRLTRSNNPSRRIIVVTDRCYFSFFEGTDVELVDIQRDVVSEGLLEFRAAYKHYSVNPEHYERFCFERWFVLQTMMRSMSIEQCCYLDSDNVLLSPLSAIVSGCCVECYDMVMHTHPRSAWFCCVTLDTVDRFVQLIRIIYALKEDELERFMHWSAGYHNTFAVGERHGRGKSFPHFSDMHALCVFQSFCSLDLRVPILARIAELCPGLLCGLRTAVIPEIDLDLKSYNNPVVGKIVNSICYYNADEDELHIQAGPGMPISSPSRVILVVNSLHMQGPKYKKAIVNLLAKRRTLEATTPIGGVRLGEFLGY